MIETKFKVGDLVHVSWGGAFAYQKHGSALHSPLAVTSIGKEGIYGLSPIAEYGREVPVHARYLTLAEPQALPIKEENDGLPNSESWRE